MKDLRMVDYALATVGALAASVLLTPLAIRVARRAGIVDHPAPSKFHQVPTPYLGGVAVAVAVLAVVFVPSNVRGETVVVMGAALLVGAVGLLDDWRTLRPAPRLATQVVAATALWAVDIRLTVSGNQVLDYVATVFVVVAVTNAFNLLDNMNGVVPGVGAIAAAVFFVVAWNQGEALVALMSAALVGACLGFLPYNFGRARIFLGDAGALFVGFLLATIAIKIDLPGYPLLSRGAIPALVLGVPLFDTALVVVSRMRGKRPVFRGATDHSSHRLVRLGRSPREAALTIYLAAAGGGGVALVLLALNSQVATEVAAAVGITAAASIGWLFERVGPAVGGDRTEHTMEPARGGA